MNLNTQVMDLGAVNIEYLLSGTENKPVLTFVHGLSANLRQYLDQMEYFRSNYRVLLFSIRGHGGSGCPKPVSRTDFTLEAIINDIILLFDKLDIPAVHWVGNSMGGLLGYELLAKDESRLLSLTTFGIPGEMSHGPVFVKMLDNFKEILIRLKGYNGFARYFGRISSKNPQIQDSITKMILASYPAAVKYAHMNIINYSHLDTLAATNIPLLLIRAEHDRDVNKMLKTTLPIIKSKEKCAIVDLPGASHFANMDQPDKFNRILDEWLVTV